MPVDNEFEYKVDLVSKLDEAMRNRDKSSSYKAPKHAPTIRPTDASVQWIASNGALITEGKCLRQIYYRINGYEETSVPVARLLYVWEHGYWWERLANDLSKSLGMLIGKSVKFRDERLPIHISGEMDAVHQTESGEKYVIDYKTTGGNYQGNIQLLGNSKHKRKPKISNLLQLMVYINHDPELKFGMLCYLIRDKMERCMFEIEIVHDDETGLDVAKINGEIDRRYSVQEIYRRYELICKYHKDKVIPPPDYYHVYTKERAKQLFDLGLLGKTKYQAIQKGKKEGDWQCSYCPFKQQCLSDLNKDKENDSKSS